MNNPLQKPVTQIELPGYKILSTLGKGGMATVYLAIQESFEREVALKVMSPDLLEDSSFGERFLREAKIVSRLVHPNIVSVYDVGIHNGYYFLSMEYIPGKDLTHKYTDLSLLDRLKVVKDIARALDFAGKKGYVHRDVKPENIMLHEEDGRAVLMDFGIARPSDTASGMTQVGMAIGTPHYMSPEQAKGLAVDTRADLYSLGVVLFLLVAGHVPYDGESAVVVGIMHISEDIPCLLPYLEIFQPIIDKIMAKNPDRRYQTGAEFIAALDAIPMHSLMAIAEASKREIADKKVVIKPAKIIERKVNVQDTKDFVSDGMVARSEDRITRHSTLSPQKVNKNGSWLALSLIAGVVIAGYYFQENIKQQWSEYSHPKTDLPAVASLPVVDRPELTASTALTESSLNTKSTAASESQDVTPSPAVVTLPTSAAPPVVSAPSIMEQTTVLREALKQDWKVAPELAAIYHIGSSSNNVVDQQDSKAGLIELQNFYATLINNAQQEGAMSAAQEYAASARVVFGEDEKISVLQDALTSLSIANAVKEQMQQTALQEQQELSNQLKQKQQKQKVFEQDLLKKAKAQQSAGKLIAPSGDNALQTYRELLSQNAQHPAARDAVSEIEAALAKQINLLIQKEKFSEASEQLVNARESFPQSNILLGLSMELEKAISDTLPAVMRLLVTSDEVSKLPAHQDAAIPAERTIYIGFEYRNFKGDASVLQAILYDGSRSLQIAQVPVVISGASGNNFFRIEQPVAGFADGGYQIDLVFEQHPLITTKFSVKK